MSKGSADTRVNDREGYRNNHDDINWSKKPAKKTNKTKQTKKDK